MECTFQQNFHRPHIAIEMNLKFSYFVSLEMRKHFIKSPHGARVEVSHSDAALVCKQQDGCPVGAWGDDRGTKLELKL